MSGKYPAILNISNTCCAALLQPVNNTSHVQNVSSPFEYLNDQLCCLYAMSENSIKHMFPMLQTWQWVCWKWLIFCNSWKHWMHMRCNERELTIYSVWSTDFADDCFRDFDGESYHKIWFHSPCLKSRRSYMLKTCMKSLITVHISWKKSIIRDASWIRIHRLWS